VELVGKNQHREELTEGELLSKRSGRSHAGRRQLWMVNHHASVPSKGAFGRHVGFAQALQDLGWDTTLFIASATGEDGKQHLRGFRRTKRTLEGGVPTVWVRTNAYGHSIMLRLLGMGVFALNLLAPGMTRGVPRPDVVLGSTVHPLAAWAGARLARRHHVPFVFEVRDVWPETLIDMGAIRADGLSARATRRLMTALARRASLVVAPLPLVSDWLREMGLEDKKFVWVSNGAELDPEDPAPLRDSTDGGFTFMYLGAHGRANVLDGVLDAFDEASRRRPDLDLRLRLVGQGPRKQALAQHAEALAAGDRISFEEAIPQSQVLDRAREADCLVAAISDLPVYRYGIGLNKLFMYLSAARPVVWASSAPNNPIRDSGAGVCVPSDDRDALAGALLEMAELPLAARQGMADRGRAHLVAEYSFPVLGAQLAEALDDLVGG